MQGNKNIIHPAPIMIALSSAFAPAAIGADWKEVDESLKNVDIVQTWPIAGRALYTMHCDVGGTGEWTDYEITGVNAWCNDDEVVWVPIAPKRIEWGSDVPRDITIVVPDKSKPNAKYYATENPNPAIRPQARVWGGDSPVGDQSSQYKDVAVPNVSGNDRRLKTFVLRLHVAGMGKDPVVLEDSKGVLNEPLQTPSFKHEAEARANVNEDVQLFEHWPPGSPKAKEQIDRDRFSTFGMVVRAVTQLKNADGTGDEQATDAVRGEIRFSAFLKMEPNVGRGLFIQRAVGIDSADIVNGLSVAIGVAAFFVSGGNAGIAVSTASLSFTLISIIAPTSNGAASAAGFAAQFNLVGQSSGIEVKRTHTSDPFLYTEFELPLADFSYDYKGQPHTAQSSIPVTSPLPTPTAVTGHAQIASIAQARATNSVFSPEATTLVVGRAGAGDNGRRDIIYTGAWGVSKPATYVRPAK